MQKLFILVVCFLSIGSKAQKICGTDTRHSLPISPTQLQAYRQRLSLARLTQDTVYLPLQIHLVRSSSGQQANETAILQSIGVLNQRFKPTGMQFVLCQTFHYIESDGFSSLDDASESRQLIASYNNPQTIDLYYVNDVTYGDLCGFASMGWIDDGYIVLKKGCENNGSLEHEMGHYFNLFHTHETQYGAELVDGSNCSTAGDMLCDTPADPNLQYEVLAPHCKYASTTLKDANGQLYKPLEDNIMSYAARVCANNFTTDQIVRMRYFYDEAIAHRYYCTDKVDLVVSLLFQVADFKKGQINELRMVVQNNSSYAYSGPVSYHLQLEDTSGHKTVLKSETLTRDYSPMMQDTVSFLVDLPGTLPDGIYQLAMLVDSDNLIEESNENNNYARQEVALYANGGLLPDLVVQYAGPTTHYTGELFEVQLSYKNLGNAPSPYFTQDLYVSENDQIDKEDLSLGKFWVEQLAVNETFHQSLFTGLPIAKSGYIIACADALNKVEELDDRNNCVVTQITNVRPTSSQPKPDYAITEHWINGVSDADFFPFQTVSLSLSIANYGLEIDNTRLYTGFYLSKDQHLSSDDRFLDYGMGGSGSPMQFTLPLNVSKGSYYLIAKVDFRDHIAESDENNNVYAWRVNIASFTSPDMRLSHAELSDYEWSENETVTLKGLVQNVGTNTSHAWRINLHVRKDSLRFKFPMDPLLVPFLSFPLDSTFLVKGEQKNNTYGFRIGKQWAPGKYFVAACVSQLEDAPEAYDDNCYVFDKPVIVLSALVNDLEDYASIPQTVLQLFPSPSDGEVVVLGAPIGEVTLLSQDGRAIRKLLSHHTFDVKGLAPGLYTVRLMGPSGISHKKLVVR